MQALDHGQIGMNTVAVSGSFTGRRFQVDRFSIINLTGVSDLTFLPGTINGIIGTTGVYI
jgi:hypothetical protein